MVPPQVSSVARKPLSIGFEEIAADKIIRVELPDEAVAADTDETTSTD
jgi:DNA-directed RNA polymerase subunit omega